MTLANATFRPKPVSIGSVKLANPVVLAPMSGVTDAPYRRLAARLGAGLVVSEMTASSALVEGRSFVLPDDVKRLALSVFSHRLVMARTGGRVRADSRASLQAILDETSVPA